MKFTPRPYQVGAIDAGLEYFLGGRTKPEFQIVTTGAGKSLIIANTAMRLPDPVVIFQPSKEILEQNYAKYISYGYRAAKYSASVGEKYIDKVTFATIGSVVKKPHLFNHCKYALIDECHYFNPEDGMYRDFFAAHPQMKVLGYTATPYRLTADYEGAMLKFLNRTTPKFFDRVNYFIQNSELFDAGHLSKLEYFDNNQIDRSLLTMNSNGTDFTDASVRAYIRQNKIHEKTAYYANALLGQRKNLLVFCTLIDEAMKVAKLVPGSVVLTGDTDNSLRARILAEFKAGKIRCVINVGVLAVGFDFPELETVLMARSTMSLAVYYQIIGRVMRSHKNKLSGWFVDLGGNIRKFGKIETMKIRQNGMGDYSIWNNGKQLTNVVFSAAA